MIKPHDKLDNYLDIYRQPTYYNWKSRYWGLGVSDLKRIRELEGEHAKLKRMYADLAMENHALKELVEK